MNAPAATSSRRYDLDWIRVGAFGLLIFYHVGLAYAPYDWHVHSRHTFEWMREGVLVTNPWRLTLLFLVSGAALRFMSLRRTPREVLIQRFARLAPPLIFGVLVLVTIQSWIEALDKGGFNGGYLAWLAHEFGPAGLADGVPLNHLWFVLYISAYSLIAVALLTRPGWIETAGQALERGLSRPALLLVLPLVYLATVRVLLFPRYGLTNILWWDWYNHAQSLVAFLFGFLIVGREGVWNAFQRARWPALGLAACLLPVMMVQAAHPGGGAFGGAPKNAVIAAYQWTVIVAVLGFGKRWLTARGGPVLAYLTDAVFPCYLAHQTILVIALWLIVPAGLPAWVEAPMLAVITLGGSLLVYEIVRVIQPLRPLWGLKPQAVAPGRTPADPASGYQRRRLMLIAGVAAPVVALITVLVAWAGYPGFDSARQYLSELGGAHAPWPALFNGGVLLSGVMAGMAGVGLALAVLALTGRRIAAALTAACFVTAGAGLMISGLFPYPDPRHMFVNLGLGIQIAPLLLIWGFWGHAPLVRLKLFLGVVFTVMAALTVLTRHLIWPGLVNDANVGWWERGYAIVLVCWVGVAAWSAYRALTRSAAVRAEPDEPAL